MVKLGTLWNSMQVVEYLDNISRDDGMCFLLAIIDSDLDLVFIRTTAYEFWSPSTAFLFSLRQKGYAFFVPGPQDMLIPHPSVTIRVPYVVSRSSLPVLTQLRVIPSHSQLNYHDSVKGQFVPSAFIGDIPSKHGNNRILPPSGMSNKIIIP
jgi:hypothetical protein